MIKYEYHNRDLHINVTKKVLVDMPYGNDCWRIFQIFVPIYNSAKLC